MADSGIEAASSSHGGRAAFSVYGTVFTIGDKYEPIKALGKGAYGVVCAARHRESGSFVAVKRVSPMCATPTDGKHILREIRMMRHLGRHENVISLKDLIVSEREDAAYIVMSLLEADLHKIIVSKQELTDAHFKHFMYQLLRGLRFTHNNGIIHRDLKPANLLVSKDCSLCISDFGLSRLKPEDDGDLMTEHVVTRWYRAPELMLSADGCYNERIDMWSCGCIFAELLLRKPLFPGKDFKEQLRLIFNVVGTPPIEVSGCLSG
jgi:serine/threonine protein kinase